MSSISGSVQFTGLIAPTDSSDTYAITDPVYGIDGLRSVTDHTARDAITTDRRREGMLVYTQNDGKYWKLDPDTTGWTEFSGGGGGVAGDDQQVQYNDGGAFGGDGGFTYSNTLKAVATGTGSLALGADSVALGDGSLAGGNQCVAVGTDGRAVGHNCWVEGKGCIAGMVPLDCTVSGGDTITLTGNDYTNTFFPDPDDILLSDLTGGSSATAVVVTAASVDFVGGDTVIVLTASVTDHTAGKINVISLATVGHAEGWHTQAGDGSHSEGSQSHASGVVSHAEGGFTLASGDSSHAEGGNTTASGLGSHAEGLFTTASGSAGHAEGLSSTASGTTSHAEGDSTLASGGQSHAEGLSTTASGNLSHAEGYFTVASGELGHTEGYITHASGLRSHAEGTSTTASGESSHAQGDSTTASGIWSHAEGFSTTALGGHAEGYGTTSSGDGGSHAGGTYSVASIAGQFARSDGKFASAGDGQYSILSCSVATTSATPANLRVAVNQNLTIRADFTYSFMVHICGRSSQINNHAYFIRQGIIANNGGTTAIVGSVTTIGTDNNSPGWSVNISASGSFMAITVTGDSSTVRWFARVDLIEIGLVASP